MSDVVLSGLTVLLIGAVCVLSYMLGKKIEKNEEYEKKKKTLDQVRRIRGDLSDPDVVDRLHEKFKR